MSIIERCLKGLWSSKHDKAFSYKVRLLIRRWLGCASTFGLQWMQRLRFSWYALVYRTLLSQLQVASVEERAIPKGCKEFTRTWTENLCIAEVTNGLAVDTQEDQSNTGKCPQNPQGAKVEPVKSFTWTSFSWILGLRPNRLVYSPHIDLWMHVDARGGKKAFAALLNAAIAIEIHARSRKRSSGNAILTWHQQPTMARPVLQICMKCVYTIYYWLYIAPIH